MLTKITSPRFVGQVRVPTLPTLRRYGLTETTWLAILKRQKGVCGVCGKVPTSGILAIDHYHVRNWKRMSADKRRTYVRGLVCTYDNRVWLRKGATPEKLKAAARYLEDYNKRNKG